MRCKNEADFTLMLPEQNTLLGRRIPFLNIQVSVIPEREPQRYSQALIKLSMLIIDTKLEKDTKLFDN